MTAIKQSAPPPRRNAPGDGGESAAAFLEGVDRLNGTISPAPSLQSEPVHIGIDLGSGDETALTLRRGLDVFTFFGAQAEIIIEAINASRESAGEERR